MTLPDNPATDAAEFAARLKTLHQDRRARVVAGQDSIAARPILSAVDRAAILAKTDGRCHLCGGLIDPDEKWQADHVLAHSTGGAGTVENYLAAHALCNNYRWHYSPEEFQWILKLGVWLRTQIERGTAIGRHAGELFCRYDAQRAARRKPAIVIGHQPPINSKRDGS